MNSRRTLPNLIICGTTGVGKTRLCRELCSANKSLKLLSLNELAKEHHFLLDHDDENQCDLIDDQAFNEYLDKEFFEKSPFSSPSGLVIDYHSAGLIPDNNHIHAVFVLRCHAEKLAARLTKKITEAISFETFNVCLNEAKEAFDDSMVYQLKNDTEEDLKKNVDYILQWIERWPLTTTNRK